MLLGARFLALVRALLWAVAAWFGKLRAASFRAFALAARTEAVASAATAAIVTVKLLLRLLALGKLDVGLIALLASGGLGFAALVVRSFVAVELLVAAETVVLRGWRGRLHGAQQAEIMVGVLEIVFAEHAVAGG